MWLAVQLDPRPFGDLLLQPQRVKFCPFSLTGLPDELSWPGSHFREPSHALPNFRATETGNQWSGRISAQLVTGLENESIAHSFPSQGDQCCTSFPGCIITWYYFDLAKCILVHPYFQKCTCPCFLLFSSNPASNLRDLLERICAVSFP